MQRTLTAQQGFTVRAYLRSTLGLESYGENTWDSAAWAAEAFWRTSLCLGDHPTIGDVEPIVADWFAGRGPSTLESEFERADRIQERCGYGVN